MGAAVILESLPAGARAVGLERRRVYIFLTRQGFLFALLLVVMLLGAVNYVNSMAYLMTFLLGSLFMVCMLHTYRNLRGLVLAVGKPEPVFAGDAARFPLLFDNRSGAERPALVARVADSARGTAGYDPPAVLALALPAAAALQRHLDVPAPRRGMLRVDRIVVETRYPLGLFRAWSYVDGGTCTVYPRPAGNRPLPRAQALDANQESGRHPGTDDFTGFAAYRPGDSIRRIDWRALAREQALLVKRFSGTGSARLLLAWDLMPATLDAEARLAQLCRWVVDAERQGAVYGLAVPGRTIEPGRGPAHRHDCLETLALFGTPIPARRQP